MKIQIDPHTLEKAIERGASREEIIEVITDGKIISAKYHRVGKSKVFAFKANRNGKYFKEKKIEVFYVIEGVTIVTVTVYVFYGRWEF